MSAVHIVDYGMGNLGSIRNMLARLGRDAVISGEPAELEAARRLILPGVGAFDRAMQNLEERGLIPLLTRKIMDEKVPTLGVCLGMQLLTRGSDEGTRAGLGFIAARTVRFEPRSNGRQLRLPHMGWNTVRVVREHPLLADMPPEPRFYFVHSYHVCCENEEDVLARSEYGTVFTCIIGRANVLGTQFHPEKSHRFGMRVLANFASLS